VLCLTSGPVDLAISGHHRLRGLLQLLELGRLVRDPRRHFLEVAGDVGHLDPQGTDAPCQLGDQMRAIDLQVAAHDDPWRFVTAPTPRHEKAFARVLQVCGEWNTWAVAAVTWPRRNFQNLRARSAPG